VTPVIRLLALLRPFRAWLALAIGLSACALVSGIALTGVASYLIARAAVVDDVAALTVAFAAVRGLAVGRAGFRYLDRFVSHSLTLRSLTRLRTWFYAAVEPLAPAGLTAHRSGDLMVRAVADVQTLEGFFVRAMVPAVGGAIAVAFVFLLLGAFSWPIALVVTILLLTVAIVLPLLFSRLGAQPSKDIITARAELQAGVVDQVRGLADLTVFDVDNTHRRRVFELSAFLEQAQDRLATVRGAALGTTALLVGLAALVVLALAIPRVGSGELNGVYLAMLVLVAVASFEAVQGMPMVLQQITASREAASRVFDLIDAPPPVSDPSCPAQAPEHFDLELRNVCFSYGAKRALQDVSFVLPQGHALGIVGESGSGKTTLVNLLLRLWEFDSGEVLVGGRDIRSYGGDDLRSYFSVVPQHVHLFNGTIRDNLQVANPDATEGQIEAACNAALLGDFIAKLPRAYETQVGEQGLLISGGERQRIAVARMLLKDAPFVVLDEPTANLDAETELALVTSLRPLLDGKTALIISHRPAVLDLANEVVEIAGGRLVGRYTSANG
jgi:ATP-binding cassette subfamily C protein CydC